MRIRIVDQDRSFANSICAQLETVSANTSCSISLDVDEAVSGLKTQFIDCLIIGPGVSDPLWAIRTFRQTGRSLPIVAVAPAPDLQRVESLLRAGAQECVSVGELQSSTLIQRVRFAIARMAPALPPCEPMGLSAAILDRLNSNVCTIDSRGFIIDSLGTRLDGFRECATAIGTNIFDTLRALVREGHPQAQDIAMALRDIIAGRIKSADVEVTAHDDSGRTILVHLLAINEGHGAAAAILLHDVTAERFALREFQDVAVEAELLALVAKNMDDAVLITDHNVQIEWINNAFERLYGFSLNEIRGKTPQELLHGPGTDRAVIASIQEAIDGHRGLDFEIEHYTKSGATIWAAVEMRPIFDSQGELARRIAVIRDVTARKQAELDRDELQLQLLDSSRRAGMADTATCVLHNVGNVLNSVNVTSRVLEERIRHGSCDRLLRFANMLLQHEEYNAAGAANGDTLHNDYLRSLLQAIQSDRETLLREVEELQQQIEHLKEIVVLQQSLATAKGLTRQSDVVELVEAAIRINEAGLSRHQVEVRRDYQARPTIVCQVHKVLQILVNLISNAKYALSESHRRPGIMVAHIDMRDDRIGIEISDNGVGISKATLPRIFELGFTTRKDGHGFGLHSSAIVAREIGATISARSDGEGQGASFRLEIPARCSEGELCSVVEMFPDKC